MRLLVTGAGGLLGRMVAAEALERGHETVGLDRSALDVTDGRAVQEALDHFRPQAVVHCAAYTAVDRAESEPHLAMSVNRDGAKNVASAAARSGAVPVYVSTDYVFDGARRTPYRPEDPANPLSVYGRSKLEGERATAGVAAEHLIVRTSWLYGDARGFVPAVLRRARAGEALLVVDDQEGRPTWAPQVATATLELVERGARGVWHVAGGGTCTWLELAREALRRAGLDCDVAPTTTKAFGAPAARPPYSVLNIEATEAFLGRPMTDWREALSRFLEEHGDG
jgi:dTDP-4-dehydrorhamnose reductase